MQIYGKSHIGLVRQSNQDSFYIDLENNWLVLADGMGGHNGGETASTLAVEIIKDFMQKDKSLKEAIEEANKVVYKKSLQDQTLQGMGTTVVLCKICDNIVNIAHVGDSRVYKVSKDKIKQITKDHSVVQQLIDSGTITKEQAKFHPQRNLITRALGTEKNIEIDFDELPLKPNSTILICSDGLSSYVDEKDIQDIINQNSINDAVDKLIETANANGGMDNVTVVLIKA